MPQTLPFLLNSHHSFLGIAPLIGPSWFHSFNISNSREKLPKPSLSYLLWSDDSHCPSCSCCLSRVCPNAYPLKHLPYLNFAVLISFWITASTVPRYPLTGPVQPFFELGIYLAPPVKTDSSVPKGINLAFHLKQLLPIPRPLFVASTIPTHVQIEHVRSNLGSRYVFASIALVLTLPYSTISHTQFYWSTGLATDSPTKQIKWCGNSNTHFVHAMSPRFAAFGAGKEKVD